MERRAKKGRPTKLLLAIAIMKWKPHMIMIMVRAIPTDQQMMVAITTITWLGLPPRMGCRLPW